MRQIGIGLGALVLLAGLAGGALAGDDDVHLEGEASTGLHYGDYLDEPGKAGEYVDQRALKNPQMHLCLDLFGTTRTLRFDTDLRYRDANTKSFAFGLDTGAYVKARMDYGTFVHNLGHDDLRNMQAKEANPDGAGGWTPGGKQIYHTDNDPLGRYLIAYEKFHGRVDIDLAGVENGNVALGYRDQNKRGWKQEMTIDHCAFCHVESDARRVDQRTQVWEAGATGTFGALSVNYDYARTSYADLTDAPTHRWKTAMHPVRGDTREEFASRLVYQDVTLPYDRGVDHDKDSHNAGLKLDLQRAGTVKGSYTHTRREAYRTGIESRFDAGALGYAVRVNRDVRLTAKFLAYEAKVDDHFVDLPAWRAGQGAGGQDFDWTRISALNRKVYQGDLVLGWKVAKGRHLKLDWRYKIIDRDAMAQSQTTYLYDGVNDGTAGATLVPSTPYANETRINRLKLRYDARIGRKGNYNLTYAYKSVDDPYMNPTAMCEESLHGTNSSHVSGGPIGRLYYYQRLRYGNGSNQPGESHRATGRFSYQLSPRTSLTGYLTYAKDKNDDLNIYQYDRDLLTPGLNLWTAPSDEVVMTLGWAHSRITSNANLCPPIFDG